MTGYKSGDQPGPLQILEQRLVSVGSGYSRAIRRPRADDVTLDFLEIAGLAFRISGSACFNTRQILPDGEIDDSASPSCEDSSSSTRSEAESIEISNR
jgi:hypothetical protein